MILSLEHRANDMLALCRGGDGMPGMLTLTADIVEDLIIASLLLCNATFNRLERFGFEVSWVF